MSQAKEGTLNILIVEDDDVDKMLLERHLSRASLGITSVDSVRYLKEAVEALKTGVYDIVLSDLGLPDSSGIQAVNALQQVAPDVPLIVLSGMADESVAVNAVQQGAQDYLIKDQVDGQMLVRAIRYAIERKKSERTLQAAEQRYRTIFENSAVGIMMVDDKEHLVSWNKFTETLLGMTYEDLNLRPIRTFYPEEEWEKIRAQDIRQKGMQHHLETKMICRDGTVIDVDLSLSVVRDNNDQVTGSIGVIRNITEFKAAEMQLRQTKDELERINRNLTETTARANRIAAEAERASMLKSLFLANMSHEIRTPMNAIIGFSDLLAEEALPDQQQENVNIIRDSARNLLNLINDILDFSKIEAGQLNVETTACPLQSLLAGVETMMRPMAEKKGLRLEVIQSEQVPELIHSDGARLRQCLINLVNNAIKFTTQGHVVIQVAVETRRGEPYLRFDVEDTGIGIPEDKQKDIFDSFTQVYEGGIQTYGGTGLGLAITKQLIELLGGQISLRSEKDKGSVFSMALPVGVKVPSESPSEQTEPQHTTHSTQDTPERERFTGHVLVAEDSPANQKLIGLHLKRLGLQATIVDNGKKAVDAVSGQNFDLIFMDMQMPEMNGYDATRTLREKGVTLPIVALTAYAMEEDDKKCYAVGCDDYLTKPMDRHKLIEVIHKYLSDEPDIQMREEETVGSAMSSSQC